MLQNFPKFTVAQIAQNITCGIYQIEQAKHYVDQHMNEHGGFQFFIHKTADNLIRARLQSRHVAATKYFVWIKYTKDELIGWYCQCKAGRRLVGCCAHVATLIWYFAYARHISYGPSGNLHKFFLSVTDSNAGQQFHDPEDLPESTV